LCASCVGRGCDEPIPNLGSSTKCLQNNIRGRSEWQTESCIQSDTWPRIDFVRLPPAQCSRTSRLTASSKPTRHDIIQRDPFQQRSNRTFCIYSSMWDPNTQRRQTYVFRATEWYMLVLTACLGL